MLLLLTEQRERQQQAQEELPSWFRRSRLHTHRGYNRLPHKQLLRALSLRGCGDSYVSDEVAALGHNLVEKERVEATYEADGYILYECANGCGKTEKEVLPKLVATVPVAQLVEATYNSLTIKWDAYPNASKYYLTVTKPDGKKFYPTVTETQYTLTDLEEDAEYKISMSVKYGSKYTEEGEEVTFKTLVDDAMKVVLSKNPNKFYIDVTVKNAPENASKFWFYRVNEDGTETLLADSTEPTCSIKSTVGVNTIYAQVKVGYKYPTTEKASIELKNADTGALITESRAGIGTAVLTIESVLPMDCVWVYRVAADGTEKLMGVKYSTATPTTNRFYFVADGYLGDNTYYAVTRVIKTNGDYDYKTTGTVDVNVTTPSMIFTAEKNGDNVNLNVATEYELVKCWFYAIDNGTEKLVKSTTEGNITVSAALGQEFRVEICVLNATGIKKYYNSDTVRV